MRYFFALCALMILGIFLLSCGTRDDRNDIRGQYGEPDSIRRTTIDPFWTETWIYNEQRAAYEFRRTAGCGSKRDVYLYATYPIAGNAASKPSPKAALPDSIKSFDRPSLPLAPR